MKILAVLVVMTGATSAGATQCFPGLQHEPAPFGGREVPQNAPAFANAPSFSFVDESDGGREERVMHASLQRIDPDGGVLSLEPVDGGTDWSFQLFHAGPLVEGETFFLEGDGGAPVRVGPPAPLPTKGGTLALGPVRRSAGYCAFGEPSNHVARDVFVRLSDEAAPWSAVSRVVALSRGGVFRVNRYFFGLPEETPGLGTLVGTVSVDCGEAPERQEVGLALQLEVAGASVQPPVMSTTVVLDCADLPPRGCSSAPGGTLLALVLLFAQKLVRRRPTPS